MTRNSKRSFFFVFILILLIFAYLSSTRRAGEDFSGALKNVNQNALAYVNPQTANQLLIPADQQIQLYQTFLQRYFMPWSNKRLSAWYTKQLVTDADYKQAELKYIQEFTEDPGYGINRLPNSPQWIKNIIDNMDMNSYLDGGHKKAITLATTNLRVLPTDTPSFANWKKAGEGYPFDYVQESLLSVNTPVLILHASKDGAWYLILTRNDLGWAHSEDIAYVDDQFIQQWQTGKYISLIKDNIPIKDNEQHRFRFMGRLGSIFPVAQSSNSHYEIRIATADGNDKAVIKTANISMQNAVIIPLAATQKNIAMIANQLMGKLYGWGDILGYRDCSSTMADLFTPFGIWLPRNSNDQALAGKFISFEGKSTHQKIKMVLEQGIPYFTFIKLPGHIVLYIGKNNGKGYIFQNFWGVHTKNFLGRDGRAIVGRTAITPIDLGKGYINTQPFIKRAQGMTLLGQPAS